jgi:adenine phosphoribosyltransferase
MDEFKKLIREIPNFPKPGILFYDITTLLKDQAGFRNVIDRMTETISLLKPDLVLGIEARGFIFAPALAYNIGAGFVPIRKPNKLPAAAERISYELEYGMDALEIHRDAIKPGCRVVIADDLLATGGTALASVRLAEKLGAVVVAATFVVELEFLKGRARLEGYDVVSLVRY